jgi:tRNA(Ile)-lysidine synthetase-like protein
MRISVGAGTYVVAVSGGVDSIALLHVLATNHNLPSTKFIVAHFDHGIRPDSHEDRKLVQDIARGHGLPFVHEKGNLGPGASEAKARQARYDFLQQVKDASGARAIITAHHEDDMLETAIHNLLRGSGRHGLPALQSHEHLLRPLLAYSKEHIRDYANIHKLQWHEDSTNQDIRLRRNYIRHKLMPNFSAGHRAQLRILLDQLRDINSELNGHLDVLLHTQPAVDMLDRRWFIALPHAVAKEVTHAWLKRHGVKNITKKSVERLVTNMKTGHPGQRFDIDGRHRLLAKRYILALDATER